MPGINGGLLRQDDTLGADFINSTWVNAYGRTVGVTLRVNTGTHVGNLNWEVNNGDPTVTADWVTYEQHVSGDTSSKVTVGINKALTSGGAAIAGIVFNNMPFKFLRPRYDRTSGTGTMTLKCFVDPAQRG